MSDKGKVVLLGYGQPQTWAQIFNKGVYDDVVAEIPYLKKLTQAEFEECMSGDLNPIPEAHKKTNFKNRNGSKGRNRFKY